MDLISKMLKVYSKKKEMHDSARSRLCYGLLNGNEHINHIEI